MNDDQFPSGPWTGFYTYRHFSEKCRTDLTLSFASGRLTGFGKDTVGPFVIAGSYDSASMECDWVKSYVGAHDVLYKGFREGKGIWGTWEIFGVYRGGFHIWPLGSEGAENEAEIEEAELPREDRVAMPSFHSL